MNAVALHPNLQLTAGFTAAKPANAVGEPSFQDIFQRVGEMTHSDDARRQLRDAATQMVASAFITPVLAAMRDSSTAEGPFAPNMAEKRFGPLLDQQIADRVVKSANFSLVDAIVDRYLPQHERDEL